MHVYGLVSQIREGMARSAVQISNHFLMTILLQNCNFNNLHNVKIMLKL